MLKNVFHVEDENAENSKWNKQLNMMCCDDYKRNLMKRHGYPISKNKERVIRIDVLEPVQNERWPFCRSSGGRVIFHFIIKIVIL